MGNGPGIEDGAPVLNYQRSSDLADRFLRSPGKMKCRLDIQFVRTGIQTAPPYEAGSPIPRAGTVFYDIPPKRDAVRANDLLVVVKGAYVGSTFQIMAIPEGAQDVLGITHIEAQITEKAIDNNLFPGVELGEITR